MKTWFGNLSIRLKLALIAASTTAAALIVTAAVLVTLDSRQYETQMVESLTTEAKIVAANIVGALVFEDAATAQEALNALAVNPMIEAGAAYNTDGVLVARYASENGHAKPAPEKAPPHESHINAEEVAAAVPVMQDGGAVGTIFLAGRVESAASRLEKELLTIFVLGGFALALVLPLSMRLHRSVTDPV